MCVIEKKKKKKREAHFQGRTMYHREVIIL